MALNILSELVLTTGADTFYGGMVRCKDNFATLDTEIHNARGGLASTNARFTAIEDEISAARNGEADLDTYIDGIVTEITNARDGEATLIDKIDAIDAAVLAASVVVQAVRTSDVALATGTTVMPIDDTIPQITEGDEYVTLAITPTSATNILVIDFTGFFSSSVTAGSAVALFQDTTADAIAAVSVPNYASAWPITFRHTMEAGTTSETTFKIRAGVGASGTLTFNGTGGARLFGGIAVSSMTIMEYVP